MAEATTAHTEAPGAPHKAPFPPFERDTFPSQLFWLAICFIALYVITARLVRPRVGGIIKSRGDRIDGDLAEAGRLKGESEAAMAAYEKALADARARAQAIASETRDKLHAEAEKSIAATKSAAMANVRGIATDAAAAIVTRLTGVTAPDAAVGAAVDAVLKR